MMNQVGSPEMLLGKRFLPLTGTPISNIECNSVRLDDCDPVPFAVAMLMTKSLTVFPIAFVVPSAESPSTGPLSGDMALSGGLMGYHGKTLVFVPAGHPL
jgi:hypothetical protein